MVGRKRRFMIRKITKADREKYLEFSKIFYDSSAVDAPIPESHRIAAFEEMAASQERLVGVFLECDGKPVGYGLASKMYSQEAGGIQLWLEELFVLPEYRSRGLGREFFAYMESLPNVARMRLEYDKGNVRAVALYRKLGYVDMPYGQLVKKIK